MRNGFLRKALRLLPGLLLWALISILFWTWIFNFLTDTDRRYKVTVFVNMHLLRDQDLAIALEEELPAGIRIVQVHSFDYALMDSTSLETADLYIMTERQAREHPEWLCPLPASLAASADTLMLEGNAIGLLLGTAGENAHLPDSSENPASAYLNYAEAPGEPWYLCFGQGGYHLSFLENGKDDAALPIALRLLTLK